MGPRTKASRHHSDQRVSIPTEQNFLVDHARIPAEAAHPQLMTQYGDALPVASIFLGKKVAAERGMNTKHLKIFCRSRHATDMLRFIPRCEIEAHIGVAGYVLEEFAVFPQTLHLLR